jgi:septation ring formation regulator EzrA
MIKLFRRLKRPGQLTLLTLVSLVMAGFVGYLALPAMALPAMALPAPASGGQCARNDVHCVINVGDQLITARLNALNTLSSRVTQQQQAGHITADAASALQADIATNQNGLKSLQSKLDAETSAQAARQDVRNIFWQFRIYAVVLPRDYQQLHFDIEQKLANRMETAKAALEKAIAAAPASKQAQLQSLYNDFKAQLATAEAQFDTVQSTLPTLTPENYNQDHATYASNLAKVRSAEKTAHSALHQAASDLHQIVQLLKS